MPRGPESKIQSAIVVALNDYDIWFASNNNGGLRSKTEAYALRDMGTIAGYPDMSVFGRDGQMFLFEIKAKIQVRERDISPFERIHSVSATQKIVIPELRDCGFKVAVFDSVEDAIACLEAMGMAEKREMNTPPER